MTPAERRVLDAVTRYCARHGTGPSMREVARRIRRSPTRVQQLVGRLVGAGLLRRAPGRMGALVPTGKRT